MSKDEFMDWLRENFDLPGCAQRLINNILDYVETLPEGEHYAALTALLDGSIGLSEAEIRKISL